VKPAAVLGTLLLCAAASGKARAEVAAGGPHRFAPGRTEVGLRLGAARPFCSCSPRFGPEVRLQLLAAESRIFKLGASAGYARFSYVRPDAPGRDTATTTSLRFVMRLYPVMRRRAGLYFDLGVGLAHATMNDASTNTGYSTDSPTLGVGAGIPIVIAAWLRLAPYAAALLHASGAQSCSIATGSASTAGSHCPGPRPAHSGFVGFGLEATALLGL